MFLASRLSRRPLQAAPRTLRTSATPAQPAQATLVTTARASAASTPSRKVTSEPTTRCSRTTKTPQPFRKGSWTTKASCILTPSTIQFTKRLLLPTATVPELAITTLATASRLTTSRKKCTILSARALRTPTHRPLDGTTIATVDRPLTATHHPPTARTAISTLSTTLGTTTGTTVGTTQDTATLTEASKVATMAATLPTTQATTTSTAMAQLSTLLTDSQATASHPTTADTEATAPALSRLLFMVVTVQLLMWRQLLSPTITEFPTTARHLSEALAALTETWQVQVSFTERSEMNL